MLASQFIEFLKSILRLTADGFFMLRALGDRVAVRGPPMKVYCTKGKTRAEVSGSLLL